VLDAIRNPIEPSLFEHIDGLVSFDTVAILKKVLGVSPTVQPSWWGREETIAEGDSNDQRRRDKSRDRRRRGRGMGRKIAAVNPQKAPSENDNSIR